MAKFRQIWSHWYSWGGARRGNLLHKGRTFLKNCKCEENQQQTLGRSNYFDWVPLHSGKRQCLKWGDVVFFSQLAYFKESLKDFFPQRLSWTHHDFDRFINFNLKRCRNVWARPTPSFFWTICLRETAWTPEPADEVILVLSSSSARIRFLKSRHLSFIFKFSISVSHFDDKW